MSTNDLRLGFPALPLSPWVRGFVKLLDAVQLGSLEVAAPDGSVRQFGQPGSGPHAQLQIRDWRAAGLILRESDVGFALAYSRDWIDSPDLHALFQLALRNAQALEAAYRGRWWAMLAKRLSHRVLRDNSRRGSRRNILSHYDLGNDFYALWLDPTMTYSAAWFDAAPGLSLEQAQQAKYDRILDELDAQPGQTILEVGCGWGGFAERAARRGIHVHGVTLSDAQLAWARQRIEAAGLQDRATLALCDYRDLQGQYDHIVSIEMFEAVGERRWAPYFEQLSRCLKPGGRVLIQSIDIAEPYFDDYRRNTDFIQQCVFPGGMLPSPERLARTAASAGLTQRNVLAFGLDYARTLCCWRSAFEAALPAVQRQGFDTAFVRMWRMYLCYCEAGFREGRIDVRQWTFSKA